jgi:hypothetical protein
VKDELGQTVDVPFGQGFFDNSLLIWDIKAHARKTGAGRPAWESAGEKIYMRILESLNTVA